MIINQAKYKKERAARAPLTEEEKLAEKLRLQKLEEIVIYRS